MKCVPEKLIVGFNKDKSLSFVSYYKEKGGLAHPNAFNGWISKEVPTEEFSNDPQSNIEFLGWSGGVENSWSFNARKTYVRVRDPRGFIFEVTVDNFLRALQISSKNKNSLKLSLRYQLGWDGTQVCIVTNGMEEWEDTLLLRDLGILVTKKSQLVEGKWYIKKDGTLFNLMKIKVPVYTHMVMFPEIPNNIEHEYHGDLNDLIPYLRTLQSHLIPEKYPKSPELTVSCSETPSYYFWISFDPDTYIEYKGIPSGLYELPDYYKVPKSEIEKCELVKVTPKFLLEGQEIVNSYLRPMGVDELRDSTLEGPVMFISPNFNNTIVYIKPSGDKLFVDFLVTRRFTGKPYESNVRFVLNSYDVGLLHRILKPFRMRVITGDDHNFDLKEVFYEIRPNCVVM